MKTDELIALLARDAGPVPTGVGERRFAAALALGILASLAWVQAAFGLRADLPLLMTTADFWQKVAMPLAVAVTGLVVVFRLGHPGARVRGWWLGVWLPVSLLWIWAAAVLWMADPAARMPLDERRQRWEAMMKLLRRHDIHAWRRDYLEALEKA